MIYDHSKERKEGKSSPACGRREDRLVSLPGNKRQTNALRRKGKKREERGKRRYREIARKSREIKKSA